TSPQRVVLIPSVSYGIASVAKNISFAPGEEILLLEEQYPSNYYSWKNISDRQDVKLTIIPRPQAEAQAGQIWNEEILKAIQPATKVVALGQVHWTDGTLFDLEAIGKKARENGALLIIDGSQSIGALPFDQAKIKADALFAVGYKWLLGPFALGLGYLGEAFDGGSPLEENWINRQDSDDFQGLVDYTPYYRPEAARYSVGENSNFHLLPILQKSLENLLSWGVEEIQTYCQSITKEPLEQLSAWGCQMETEANRAHHLIGIRFPSGFDLRKLQVALQENQVYASLRGDALRISVHCYTDAQDLGKLTSVIRQVLG
ncbi:MAG: aminotransferase class V-fold PLP-dependent enzyme, partial [Bacteroidota bacterium]